MTLIRSAGDALAGAGYMLSVGAAVWLPCWGVRRKYELDHKLGHAAQSVRWSIVLSCLALVDFQVVPPGNWAVVFGLIFLGFFVWPNLTFYLFEIPRRVGVVKGDVPPAD
jgi:hypothetical protein